MIKTGITVNLVLGAGDSEKFDLLGGSFGGPAATGAPPGTGFGSVPVSAKERILAAASGTPTQGGGGGTPVAPTRPGDWNPNRYVRER